MARNADFVSNCRSQAGVAADVINTFRNLQKEGSPTVAGWIEGLQQEDGTTGPAILLDNWPAGITDITPQTFVDSMLVIEALLNEIPDSVLAALTAIRT